MLKINFYFFNIIIYDLSVVAKKFFFFLTPSLSQIVCRKRNLIGIIIAFLTLPKILPVWAGLRVTSESFLGNKSTCIYIYMYKYYTSPPSYPKTFAS